MRLLTQLLTIYILLLSILPCPENLFEADEETATAVLVTTDAEDDCEDECPPNCSCECCCLQLMRTCNCVQMKAPDQFAVFNPVHKQLSILDIFRPVWQPPQLS